jgi:hypothetical protein
MAWWLYKCNSKQHPYQSADGDWREFFDDRAAHGQVARWGLISVVPELAKLHEGDFVLAYQTDRNELVGLLKMVKFVGDEVHFSVVEEFGIKVRPLKKANAVIAAIPALQPGPIQTLYTISQSDANALLNAARSALADRAPNGKEQVRLPDEAAAEDGAIGELDYTPQEGDWRRIVERQIRERRGQQRFRDALRQRYGSQCLVTGCKVLAVLEAAHITPYRGENDNHPENGLLLRADIHTLFDLDLLGIEPIRFQVELHPMLADEPAYADLAGKVINCAHGRKPSRRPLRRRYEQFRKRIQILS